MGLKDDLVSLLTTARTSSVMTVPAGELPPHVAASLEYGLQRLEDAVKGRREQLRKSLSDLVDGMGQLTDKGHKSMVVGNAQTQAIQLLRERRQAQMPDFEDLRTLVLEKGIPVEEIFETVEILEINPSKLEHAIVSGKLVRADVEKLRKTTFALKVKPDGYVTQIVEEALPTPPSPKKS